MISAALAEALRVFADDELGPPEGGRIGAALCLVRDLDGGDAEIVYTRRRDDLRSHPGQISFPGGRVDPGEGIVEAALREAREEVALDPLTVTVLGRVPPFYIPPSRFWLQVVCARWDAPHPLTPSEAEVAEILRVRISTLRNPDRLRAVQLSIRGWSWAWEVDAGTPLWGATAMVTAVLLGLLDPDWAGGREPRDLPTARRLRPWLEGVGRGADVPRPGPPRLAGVPSRPLAGHPSAREGTDGAGAWGEALQQAGRAVALAVQRLDPGTARSDAEAEVAGDEAQVVVVLAGTGATGAVARRAATVLEEAGTDVVLVEAGGQGGDALARAAVVIDGLCGHGLRGPLEGRPLALVHALRDVTPVVVAVDMPSGLDPEQGLVGELVTADVTVALGDVAAGLLAPGLGPFVGDLYLAGLAEGEPPLVRVVVDEEEEDAGTWRE